MRSKAGAIFIYFYFSAHGNRNMSLSSCFKEHFVASIVDPARRPVPTNLESPESDVIGKWAMRPATAAILCQSGLSILPMPAI